MIRAAVHPAPAICHLLGLAGLVAYTGLRSATRAPPIRMGQPPASRPRRTAPTSGCRGRAGCGRVPCERSPGRPVEYRSPRGGCLSDVSAIRCQIFRTSRGGRRAGVTVFYTGGTRGGGRGEGGDDRGQTSLAACRTWFPDVADDQRLQIGAGEAHSVSVVDPMRPSTQESPIGCEGEGRRMTYPLRHVPPEAFGGRR